jgi:hypothetical protein
MEQRTSSSGYRSRTSASKSDRGIGGTQFTPQNRDTTIENKSDVESTRWKRAPDVNSKQNIKPSTNPRAYTNAICGKKQVIDSDEQFTIKKGAIDIVKQYASGRIDKFAMIADVKAGLAFIDEEEAIAKREAEQKKRIVSEENIVAKAESKTSKHSDANHAELINHYKEKKATFIASFVSHHIWEIFEDTKLFYELEIISEGDGWFVNHWAFWPVFKKPNGTGRIAGFVRTDDDVEKLLVYLRDAGCDPTKPNKKGENTFDSFAQAVLKGYFTEKPRNDVKDLEIRNFYMNLIFNIPAGMKSARSMARDIINTANSKNFKKFRVKFCWAFFFNPEAIAIELVKSFFQLQGNAHTGDGIWNHVRQVTETCREMLRAGPIVSATEIDETVKKLKKVSDFIGGRWNTDEQIASFSQILGEVARTYKKELDCSTAFSTECSACRGAIVGESGNINSQRKFVIDMLFESNYQQAIYCVAHTEGFDTVVIEEILKHYDSFETHQKRSLGCIAVTKNNWSVDVLVQAQSLNTHKRFDAYPSNDQTRKYFETIVSCTEFDSNIMLSTIVTKGGYDPEGVINVTEVLDRFRKPESLSLPKMKVIVTLNSTSCKEIVKEYPAQSTKASKKTNDQSLKFKNDYWEQVHSFVRSCIPTPPVAVKTMATIPVSVVTVLVAKSEIFSVWDEKEDDVQLYDTSNLDKVSKIVNRFSEISEEHLTVRFAVANEISEDIAADIGDLLKVEELSEAAVCESIFICAIENINPTRKYLYDIMTLVLRVAINKGYLSISVVIDANQKLVSIRQELSGDFSPISTNNVIDCVGKIVSELAKQQVVEDRNDFQEVKRRDGKSGKTNKPK